MCIAFVVTGGHKALKGVTGSVAAGLYVRVLMTKENIITLYVIYPYKSGCVRVIAEAMYARSKSVFDASSLPHYVACTTLRDCLSWCF